MLYRTCFALAPVGSSSAGKYLSCMHVACSQASELVMMDKGGGNFDRGAYQCQLLK